MNIVEIGPVAKNGRRPEVDVHVQNRPHSCAFGQHDLDVAEWRDDGLS